MAKKSSGPTFREVMTSIKRKNFFPVYLLMGEEDYYIDQLTKALEINVVDEQDRDFNSIVFYGADADITNVIGAAQQYPVMAERQLVILKEAQAMTNAKNQLEKLSSYIGRPNKSTVLVIVYKGGELSSTSSLMKAAKGGNAIVFRSEKLRDFQLAGPIKDYCASKSISIDDKAINLLCDYIGNPLSKLFGEIDKLIVAGGKDIKRISPELIENNIGISKDFNTFELIKALARKDYLKAMTIVDYFAHNPKQNPTVLIIATIFGYFSKLFIASVSRDKSDAALIQALDLRNVYALPDYRDGLRNYSARMVLAAIHAIREFDTKSKGIESTQNEYELLKELVFKIFTAQ
ncbi:MAG: DNA polymerase III subunit delta [Muribaculaceae bacterium]|nr:DNA polymerase III subunit delta [Muribaculaceae bacterium]MDE6753858.1 DNA polymerase III subunit delta [Muribaculaceae bacterium]